MAFNTSETQDKPTEAYALARYGISLIINNKAVEAQELFRTHADSIQMSAGYSFALFIDALLSFEEDKILLALTVLRETEKQCAGEMGWLKNVKTKMFGANTTQSLAERLESQIILADTQVCVALVTFLQQEFTGFLKGGWVLRKAWKLYQHTYEEILVLYKKSFGDFNLPEPTDFEWTDDSCRTRSSISTEDVSSSMGSTEWVMPDSAGSVTPSKQSNGYPPISSPTQLQKKLPQSQSTFQFPKSSSLFNFSIRRSGSAHSSLNKNAAGSSFSLWSPIATQLSYLGSTLSLLTSTSSEKENDEIPPEVISRLMGAVCFGYGALQLGMSLLPPSLSKVSNFLGFNGNRMIGISNLMYSRKGSDMRAPLATLALLWYHTIVRPFFVLDGRNVKAGLESAELLMQESMQEYEDSALFWFFRGRIHRLNSNIALALESFQAAANKSPQREIKLLAFHEVAWCYLIQLDFEQAQKVFINLKKSSRWSKIFYAFLSFICAGTYNQNDMTLLVKMRETYTLTTGKSTQLDTFLRRRLNLFPVSEEALHNTSSFYWKFIAYEILFLWNALPSCDTRALDTIINDCNESADEPMPGLAMFLQGECYTILGLYENAINSFRKCIEIRSNLLSLQTQTQRDDIHISANTEYSLALILVKQSETKEEGLELLLHASQYKDFDFDTKLHVRINQAIKNIS